MINRPMHDLPTPALLLDMPTFERNVTRMRDSIIEKGGIGWRPHVKAVRVPELARKLIDAGALGVTCATLADAEAMVAGGIPSVLIANQIATPAKAARLAALQRHAEVIIGADSSDQLALIAAAASTSGTSVPVAIEVDIGIGRAGVTPGAAVLALANAVVSHPNLRLAGLFGWEGAAKARIADLREKTAAIAAAVASLVASAALCRNAGVPIGIVSCGGTGTYWISSTQPGVTEVQAGGGVFGDLFYRESCGVEHEFALSVLTTVVGRPSPTRIVCDSGWKSMSQHLAMPRPIGIADIASVKLSAEHATINLAAASATPAIGDQVEFVVGYCDSTMFLHEELYVVTDGMVSRRYRIPRVNPGA